MKILPRTKGAIIAKRKGRFNVLQDPALGVTENEKREQNVIQEQQIHRPNKQQSSQPAAKADFNRLANSRHPCSNSVNIASIDLTAVSSQQNDSCIVQQPSSLIMPQPPAVANPSTNLIQGGGVMLPTNIGIPIASTANMAAPSKGGVGTIPAPLTTAAPDMPTVKIVPRAVVAKRKGRFSVLQDPSSRADGPAIVLTSGGGVVTLAQTQPISVNSGPLPMTQPSQKNEGTSDHTPQSERKEYLFLGSDNGTGPGTTMEDSHTPINSHSMQSFGTNDKKNVAATSTSATISIQGTNQFCEHCARTNNLPTSMSTATIQQPAVITGHLLNRPAASVVAGSNVQKLPPGTKKKGRFVLLSTSEPAQTISLLGVSAKEASRLLKDSVTSAAPTTAAVQAVGPVNGNFEESRLIAATGGSPMGNFGGVGCQQQMATQFQRPLTPQFQNRQPQVSQILHHQWTVMAHPQSTIITQESQNQPSLATHGHSMQTPHTTKPEIASTGCGISDQCLPGILTTAPPATTSGPAAQYAHQQRAHISPEATPPPAAALPPSLGHHSASLSSHESKMATGVHTATGLGKVFYFLDQMKLEVTEADKTIKSTQKENKFLVRLYDFSSYYLSFICAKYTILIFLHHAFKMDIEEGKKQGT